MKVHLKGGFYVSVKDNQKHLVGDRADATVVHVWERANQEPGIRVKTRGVRCAATAPAVETEPAAETKGRAHDAHAADAADVEFETEIAASSLIS